MPIDTSIYSMLGQGVTPLKSPQEVEAQVMQLRQMAAQTNLLETQQKGAAGQAADAELLKTTAQSVMMKARQEGREPEPIEFEQAFRATGTPAGFKAAHEAEQARVATEKQNRESKLVQLTVAQHEQTAVSQVTGGLLALPPEQRAAAWPQALEALARVNPEKTRAVAQKYPQFPGDDIIAQMHNFSQTEQQRLQQAQADQVKAHQEATLAETQRHNKASEETARIQASKPSIALINGQGLPQTFDPAQPLADPSAEAIAHQIGSWETKPPSLNQRATPQQRQAVARADWLAKNQYGHSSGLPGDADIADIVAGRKDYGPQGRSGQAITAAGTAARHLAYLDQMSEALKNGDNQSVNKAAQAWAKWSGKAAPTNFGSVQNLVIPEVLRAAKGAGLINEKEEERFLQQNSSASGPAQLKGFTDSLIHLMGDRIKEMQPNYARYNRGGSIADRLSPEAAKLFSSKGITFGGNAAKGTSNAPTGSPASPGGLAPTVERGGKTYYLYSDGNYYSQKPGGQ